MASALDTDRSAAAAGPGSSVCCSRRGFLQSSVAGVAAGILTGSGAALAVTSAARAQTTMNPEAALHEMMAGNRRFVEGRMTSFNDDLKALKAKTFEKQEPFGAVLSCADSRVPIELIFDQSIGRLFVTRVAGNVASSEIIASLEYGVAVLGTKAIIVMGHANCGAVKASIDAKAVPGQISGLYRYIRPAVDQAGRNLEAATKANARIQAALLRESSPVIADAFKKDQLKVVAAYYDLASGKVSLLD
ncbi:MAG: carbonic anhydrase [Alphaproteobacteria bacterium]|nr:carbonic anhydrase [Alphaproteobacteria bacterium]